MDREIVIQSPRVLVYSSRMSGNITLHLAGSFESALKTVVLPFFREMGLPSQRRDSELCVLLVPSRAYGFFIKSRLLEADIHFAGIKFWTPGEARDRLLDHLEFGARTASRESLRLILSASAESIADVPIIQSVARDPESLLRCMDRLLSAGWTGRDLGIESLNPLLSSFEASMKKAGFTTTQAADRYLCEHAATAEPSVGRLLVMGFDGSHWDQWPLLNAVVASSKKAEVCLFHPRYKSEQVDQVWIGSWEEKYGAARPIEETDDRAQPFEWLAAEMETQIADPAARNREGQPALFHVGLNLQEEAEAVVAQCLLYLPQSKDARIGVLFSGYSALSREVSARLRSMRIDFNDTLGYYRPLTGDEECWLAWLDLLSEPDLESFLKYIRFRPEIYHSRIHRILDKAYTDVGIGDIKVLGAYLDASPDEESQGAARILQGTALLPDKATLAEFVSIITDILNKLDWSARAQSIGQLAADLSRTLMQPISRSTFLRWLRDITPCGEKIRDDLTVHPYARVHLLTYNQAEWQTWSHLILTGLNENEWPPAHESLPFLGEKKIAALNARAVRQGSQGEGHLTVNDGRGWIVGPLQRALLVQRQFYNLMESTSSGLCATMALTDEANLEKRHIPSDLLTHLFFSQQHVPLSDKALDALRENTRSWLATVPAEQARSKAVFEALQTQKAYLVRRDAKQPFGGYEFSLTAPAPFKVVLGCKEWETAVQHPAPVWLKHFVGVEKDELDFKSDRWALIVGTWVHRWLSRAASPYKANAFVHCGGRDQFLKELELAAQSTRNEVGRAYREAGKSIPDWWLSGWEQALWVASNLASWVTGIDGWASLATEWSLPRDLTVLVEPGHELRLKGRIDLVFAESSWKADTSNRYWVLDFKTGSDKPLSSKKLSQQLLKGDGVQLSLYALALKNLQATDVLLNLVGPEDTACEPQAALADVAACASFWKALYRMQVTGQFGMRGELRPEYGFAPDYPLATLEIDPGVLEEKWALSHPDLTEGSDVIV